MMTVRAFVLVLAVSTAAAMHAPGRRLRPERQQAKEELLAAKQVAKPPAILHTAYSACGLATTAAWATVVLTAIAPGAPGPMPTYRHGLFARTGALSAAPIIVSTFATLAAASKDSWEQMGSSTCRRLNLALVAAGVGSALWVGFAPRITQIPGTSPPVSHASYKGLTRAALIGSYGSAAALSAAVWVRSLPEEVRGSPLQWPGRVADGVAKSLVSLAPASTSDPVNVKYSLLSTSFLVLTAIGFGNFPLAVCPSWTGRRCSRAFPAWMFLAAVSSYNLKEATEQGKLLAESAYRTLSTGLTVFGGTYLAAKFGAVFLDPSFPVHYKIVTQVPTAQAAAALMIGLTLRPDTAK